MASNGQIQVSLPGGELKRVDRGVKAVEVLAKAGIAKGALAARINDEVADLSTVLSADCSLEPVTFESKEGRDVLRHSTSHVMASAVQRLYGKDVKLGFGPAIEDGFYYDFDLPERLNEESLQKIEAEMRRIIEEDVPFERVEVSKQEARDRLAADGETYKVEYVDELDDPRVSFYTTGTFYDFCRGPHLDRTSRIAVFMSPGEPTCSSSAKAASLAIWAKRRGSTSGAVGSNAASCCGSSVSSPGPFSPFRDSWCDGAAELGSGGSL